MNYFKRAWSSVIRRKGKSLILFAVIFILGNVIAGAIAIQQSTSNVEKKTKADLGAVATVDVDYNKYMEDNPGEYNFQIDTLKEKDIQDIGAMSYVKEYDYSVSGYAATENFKLFKPEIEGYSGGSDVYLKGTKNQVPMDFQNKSMNLVDGQTFSKEDLESELPKVLISSKLAEENGLAVGDEFVLDAHATEYKEDGTMEKHKVNDYPMQVVGIFEPAKVEKKDQDSSQQSANSDPFVEMEQFNSIYMPNQAVQTISKEVNEVFQRYNSSGSSSEEDFYAVPTYILNSPEDVEAFKEEVAPLLPEYNKVTASTDKYDEVAGSMKKLSQISGYVVLVAIVATLVIISLVVVLFLRDRKHELGIYLSLGEKRQNVVGQIILELLVISLVAMTFSLVTGNLLGKTVSESLLQSDVLAADSSSSANSGMMIVSSGGTATMPELSAEDVQNAYEVKFSTSYIVTFLIAGLATVFGSAIIPLAYILRLNPKKIMM